MARNMLAIAMFVLALSGCEGNAPSDAQHSVSVLTGDSDNPVCRLFEPEELQPYVGEPLDAGQNAGMGSGCQWAAKDGEGDAMITAVAADYAENPYRAEGYRRVRDIGKDGFVLPEFGGWAAGAVVGQEFVKVSVNGEKADEAAAVALLRETIRRRS